MKLDKTPIAKAAFLQSPTLNEFSAFFMEHFVAPRNRASEIDKKRQIIENFINPMLGEFKLNELEQVHIDEFISRMRAAKCAPKTVNNRLAVLGKMLRYALARKLIEKIPQIEPMKVIKPEIRFLTVAEVRSLLAAAQEDDSLWYAMICLGVNTGMRIGELRALHWEDIDPRRQCVRVHRSLYGKLEQSTKTVHGLRTIPLNQTVITGLKRIVRVGPIVFSGSPKGDVVSYWACKQALKRIADSAGLKSVGWHTLRHTFASHLVMLGHPIRIVQELLGHSDIKMTMRYSHLTPDCRSTAVDSLVTLFKS